MPVGAGITFLCFTVYYRTLAPGLTFIDSGELAAVCATLGIAHPTGYPLYTLLGRFFVQLPLPARPIFVLNLLSCLLSCLGLFFFYLTLYEIFTKGKQNIPSGGQTLPGSVTLLSAAGGTLLLGFCGVFWSVALVTEVYALHALFVALLLLLAMKLFLPAGCNQAGSAPAWFLQAYLLAFVLGCSFGNHMSTVLLLPCLCYLFFSERKQLTGNGPKIFLFVGLFLCGLSFYLYLPVRAAQFPALNWGNPQTWEKFFWHVTGKQYRVWMFASLDTALKQFSYFFQLLAQSFGYLPLLLIPFGAWYLKRMHPQAFYFSLILLLTDIFYGVNYDIQDVASYFLPAFMVCALWMGSALFFCGAVAYLKKRVFYRIGTGVLSCLFLVPLVLQYRDVDQSQNRLVAEYTKNIMTNAAENALILSYQWDYFCSAFYYLQLVEGLRPDLTLIEVKLLKRSWYLTQLQKNHPGLMQRSQDEVAAFAVELNNFEHGQPYEPAVIQNRYMEMINSFIRKNMDSRPVYLTCEIEKEIGAGLNRVPQGLVFRLTPASSYMPFAMQRLSLPAAWDFNENNRYHLALRSFYTFMLANRASYEARFGNLQTAGSLFQKALRIDPTYPLAKKGFAKIRQALSERNSASSR